MAEAKFVHAHFGEELRAMIADARYDGRARCERGGATDCLGETLDLLAGSKAF